MKIEKINDNQIRCTLTHSDLADRQLKISELAYGSDKAKSLFKDMMEQASYEFGFEAEDIPLMIEAVPISSECIVLTITKVEDPEELDTRFSKFAPAVHNVEDGESEQDIEEISEEVMNLFQKVQNSDRDFMSDIAKTTNLPSSKAKVSTNASTSLDKKSIIEAEFSAFQFDNLYDVIKLAHAVSNYELGNTALYKDNQSSKYYLVAYSQDLSASAFNRLCNTASEFGTSCKKASGSESYFKIHYELIIDSHALQSLSEI